MKWLEGVSGRRVVVLAALIIVCVTVLILFGYGDDLISLIHATGAK